MKSLRGDDAYLQMRLLRDPDIDLSELNTHRRPVSPLHTPRSGQQQGESANVAFWRTKPRASRCGRFT